MVQRVARRLSWSQTLAPLAAWALAAVSATGCFTVQTAQPDALWPLRSTHDDHAVLHGPNSNTRVDPTSPVRFKLARDGKLTSWLLPSRLLVNESGVMLDEQMLRLDELNAITIRGLDETEFDRLAATAPPLNVIRESGRLDVVGPGVALAGWFEQQRPSLAEPQADERWVFSWLHGGATTTVAWSASDVRSGTPLPSSLSNGLRWVDIAALEVEHPDYAAVLGLMLAIPLGAALGGSSMNLVKIPDRAAPFVTATDGVVLRQNGLEAPNPDRAAPLFSELAIRRAGFRPFAAAEFANSFFGTSSAFAVTGGVRVRDVFEFGLGLRLWWVNLFGSTPYLTGEPLGPLTSKYVPTVYPTLRLGCTFDLDADRRVFVLLHAELGYNFRDSEQIRIAWGVQVRVFGGLYVALRPFTPQYTRQSFSLANWQFPTSLEFGSTF